MVCGLLLTNALFIHPRDCAKCVEMRLAPQVSFEKMQSCGRQEQEDGKLGHGRRLGNARCDEEIDVLFLILLRHSHRD